MGDNEVDLYADVVDTFPQSDENTSSMLIGESVEDRPANLAGVDMLDEVIAATSSMETNKPPVSQPTHQEEMMLMSNQAQANVPNFASFAGAPSAAPVSVGLSNVAGKRVSLYVQNLTWWTTDDDLRNALQALGVDDLIEIKFFENRVNGQSRGIALVTVASDNSARIIMERLPRSNIHGQTPEVTHANRQNIHQLDLQSGLLHGAMPGRKDNAGNNGLGMGRMGSMNPARLPNPALPLGANAGSVPLSNPAAAAIFLNHLAQQASFLQRPMQQRPNNMFAAMAQLTARFRATQPRGPTPMPWQERTERYPTRMMNPSGQAMPDSQLRQLDQQIDPVEVQQLLERNKMISSNALAASVQSASDGDYAAAIETLVTAISLIKQSKIAEDDRSQILISSLQDTLRSIEEKSYLSAPRKRSSSRDRHRFPGEQVDRRARRSSPSDSRRDHFGPLDRRHSRSPITSEDRHRRGRRSPAARRSRRSSSSSSGSFRRSKHTSRRGSKGRSYNDYSSYPDGRR